MPNCRCGAKWRHNFPHGKNSKGRRVYIVGHHSDCNMKDKPKFKITRSLIAKRKAKANS